MFVRNNSLGTRGVPVAGGYKWLEPGETMEVDSPAGLPHGVHIVRAPADPTVEVPPIPAELEARIGRFEGFLDRSIPKIVADLPDQSDDALRSILADEESGKSRKGVINAVEAELEARG